MNDPEMSALGVDLRVAEAGFQHVEEVKSEETCREKSIHVCAKARFPANDLLALQPDTAPRQSHNANSETCTKGMHAQKPGTTADTTGTECQVTASGLACVHCQSPTIGQALRGKKELTRSH